MNELDFQARGTLIAAHHLHSDRYVILVDTGSDPHPYCVSTYTSSNGEWDSGTYTDDPKRAAQYFADKVKDQWEPV
jgi:hypothetical protein